jgi:hypothetical protein
VRSAVAIQTDLLDWLAADGNLILSRVTQFEIVSAALPLLEENRDAMDRLEEAQARDQLGCGQLVLGLTDDSPARIERWLAASGFHLELATRLYAGLGQDAERAVAFYHLAIARLAEQDLTGTGNPVTTGLTFQAAIEQLQMAGNTQLAARAEQLAARPARLSI